MAGSYPLTRAELHHVNRILHMFDHTCLDDIATHMTWEKSEKERWRVSRMYDDLRHRGTGLDLPHEFGSRWCSSRRAAAPIHHRTAHRTHDSVTMQIYSSINGFQVYDFNSCKWSFHAHGWRQETDFRFPMVARVPHGNRKSKCCLWSNPLVPDSNLDLPPVPSRKSDNSG